MLKHSDKISTDEQMIKNPYSSAEEWDRLVYRSPGTVALNLEPISHPETRFYKNSQEVIIKFEVRYAAKLLPFYFFSHLYRLDNNIEKQLPAYWTMAYVINKVAYIHVRCPSTGLYRLDISAKFEDKMYDKAIPQYFTCFQYLITNRFSGKSQPFPSEYQWGAAVNFLAAGFRIKEPTNVVINTKDGKAVVKIKLPSWGFVENTCHLSQVDVKQSSTSTSIKEIELDEWVYAEKCGDIATYYINCPKQGEYRFEMWAKYESGPTFHSGAAFLIQSENPTNKIYKQPNEINILGRLAGPWDHMYNMGLTCSIVSSTIASDTEGNGVLIVKNLKQVSVFGKIKCANNPNCEKLLSTTKNNDDIIFTIKKPAIAGYYWLLLYANEKSSENHSCAGCFCFPEGV